MLNGLHFSSPSLHRLCTQSALQLGLSFTHSYPVGSSCRARWRWVGVQCLHFDMLDSWSRDRTANLTVTGRPALPTELQPPMSSSSRSQRRKPKQLNTWYTCWGLLYKTKIRDSSGSVSMCDCGCVTGCQGRPSQLGSGGDEGDRL